MIIMDDCPICKEEIKETNTCKTTCGHIYCLSCMIKHSKNNNRCPLCRVEIFERIIEEESETESESEEESEIYETRLHTYEFHGKYNNREIHGKIKMNHNLQYLFIFSFCILQCYLIQIYGFIMRR
jgi:hypothetical protein